MKKLAVPLKSGYRRKSWVEKRDTGKQPVVKKIDRDFADMHASDRMLIPTPILVDTYIRHIPRGRSSTLPQMRIDLAEASGADVTCPVTSGIFLRIVAEAAWEEIQMGKPLTRVTPFWRMITSNSSTAGKLTFGNRFLKEHRRKERLDER